MRRTRRGNTPRNKSRSLGTPPKDSVIITLPWWPDRLAVRPISTYYSVPRNVAKVVFPGAVLEMTRDGQAKAILPRGSIVEKNRDYYIVCSKSSLRKLEATRAKLLGLNTWGIILKTGDGTDVAEIYAYGSFVRWKNIPQNC